MVIRSMNNQQVDTDTTDTDDLKALRDEISNSSTDDTD